MIQKIIYRILDWFRDGQLGARSSQWSSVRNTFIQKHPHCEVCGTSKNCEVHHEIPYHIDPSKELMESNFLVLCRPDHYLFGHLNSWKSWNPNVRKDVAEWKAKIANRP